MCKILVSLHDITKEEIRRRIHPRDGWPQARQTNGQESCTRHDEESKIEHRKRRWTCGPLNWKTWSWWSNVGSLSNQMQPWVTGRSSWEGLLCTLGILHVNAENTPPSNDDLLPCYLCGVLYITSELREHSRMGKNLVSLHDITEYDYEKCAERAIPFIPIFPLQMFKCTLWSTTKERANDLDTHMALTRKTELTLSCTHCNFETFWWPEVAWHYGRSHPSHHQGGEIPQL